MSMIPDAALDALATAAGAGNATSEADRLAPLLTDWRGRFHGATPLLLLPRTTDDVVAIVRAAAHWRVPLVPQGGNTGLVGGGIPPAMAVPCWSVSPGSTAFAPSMPRA